MPFITLDYNDENDELVDNDEYDDTEDYDEELEDSLGDEVYVCIFVPFLLLWYFPDLLEILIFQQEEPVKRRRVEPSNSEDLYHPDDIDSPSRLSPPLCMSRPRSSPLINLSDEDSLDFRIAEG